MDAATAREDRFPHFDALRAIAAVSVLLFHAVGIYGGGLADGATGRAFIARMEVGVPIFLAISGFLLYRPFVAAHAAGRPAPATGAYAWRRALRIVPAYWVALSVGAVALSWTYVLQGSGPLEYYGFGQLYTLPPLNEGAIAPAWTLGIELSFYVFLPFFAAALRARRSPRAGGDGRADVLRRHATGVAALWLASVGYCVLMLATGVVGAPVRTNEPFLLALPGTLHVFALGMALAVVSVATEGRRLPRSLAFTADRPWLPWAGAAVAFVLSAVAIGLTGDPQQPVSPVQFVAKWQLYGLVALGLLWPAVLGDQRQGFVRRVLAVRPLVWTGIVSYGVYLWHWPILQQLQRWDLGSVDVRPAVLWGTTTLALSLLLGAVSYVVVERPALSLRRLVPTGDYPTKPSGTASDSKVRMQ